MDNRIPKIIQDFTESERTKSEIDFLSFDDWLSKRENQSQDWIIIARNQKVGEYEDYFTTSCLVSSNDSTFTELLSDSHWFISSSFGIPEKYQTPYENEAYDDGLIGELKGITYKPFTFLRHYNSYLPDHFQVIEHFLLYYNCFKVDEKSEFQSIDENGEIITVLKYVREKNNEQILVDAHTLKDYLAVRGVSLARFHDHRRRSTHEISDFLDGEFSTYTLSNNESFYELDLRIDIQYKEVKSTSRLLGKDIVKPYPTPKRHECSTEKDADQYLEFVIGRDEAGKEVKSTCNPDLLSNYFTDRGAAHYLTAVFFQRQLLNKYYSEPKKYEVSELSVGYLNIWGIEIAITSEGLIQVYLGDIGRDLPFNEQLHWRQYNVVPKGEISEHRFKRDFLNQFASPELEEAPILHFKESFEIVQDGFLRTHGRSLFESLGNNDEHLYATIHVPTTEEWKELDEQILALAKITVDSFDNKILQKLTGKKIGGKGSSGMEIKGLLGLFYEYLILKYPNEEERDSLIQPFNMIQTLRSSSVAHRKGKTFNEALVKYDLKGLSNEQKFRRLVMELTKVLKALTEGLK